MQPDNYEGGEINLDIDGTGVLWTMSYPRNYSTTWQVSPWGGTTFSVTKDREPNLVVRFLTTHLLGFKWIRINSR